MTQLPLVSLTIPAGTDAWVPAMFGQASGGGGGGVQPLVDRVITIELSGSVPLLDGVPFPQAPISLTFSFTEFTSAGTAKLPENVKPFDDLNWPLPTCCAGLTVTPFDWTT